MVQTSGEFKVLPFTFVSCDNLFTLTILSKYLTDLPTLNHLGYIQVVLISPSHRSGRDQIEERKKALSQMAMFIGQLGIGWAM